MDMRTIPTSALPTIPYSIPYSTTPSLVTTTEDISGLGSVIHHLPVTTADMVRIMNILVRIVDIISCIQAGGMDMGATSLVVPPTISHQAIVPIPSLVVLPTISHRAIVPIPSLVADGDSIEKRRAVCRYSRNTKN